MRLTRLHIKRAPGIPGGFLLEQLGAGVVIILGPNGSGKSTLCRGISALIWPQGEDELEVEATFKDEAGSLWNGSLLHGRTRWQREGEATQPPADLPGPSLLPCYRLNLADLLTGETEGDQALARRIRDRMAGGYKIKQTMAEHFGSLSAPQKKAGLLVKLGEALRNVEGEFKKLSRQEDDLDLKRQAQALARERITRLDQLLKMLEESTRLEAALSTLAEEQQQAKGRQQQTGLLGTVPDGPRLEELDGHLKTLQGLETASRQAELELKEAQGRLATCAALLGVPPAAPPPALGDTRFQKLEHFLGQADRLRAEQAELVARRSSLPAPGEKHEDAEVLGEAVQALRAWLREPASTPWPRASWLPWIMTSLLLLGGALGWLAVWLSLLPAALLVFFLCKLLLGSQMGGGNARLLHERRFRDTGLAPLARFDPPFVETRLLELEKRLQDAREAARVEGIRLELQAKEAQMQSDQEILAETRSELAGLLGPEQTSSDLSLVETARRLQAWREAGSEVARRQAGLEAAQQQAQQPLQTLNEALKNQNLSQAQDATAAAPLLTHLRRRSLVWHEARKELQRIHEKRQLVRQELSRLAAQKKTLLQQLELAAVPDRADLQQELQETRTQQEERARQIGAIEQALRKAREGQDYEQTRASQEALRLELEEMLEQAWFQEAGRFLLEKVEGEFQQRSEPRVLKQARELFLDFTRNRYRLLLAPDDDQSFRALDTTTQQGLSLAQLSDGTRVQLLLAARLAFVFTQESRLHLPLFLDEALSTADPQRFQAVAEALVAVAASGRQIFYLTANPADAEAWLHHCEQQQQPKPTLFKLAHIRQLEAAPADPACYARLEPPLPLPAAELGPEAFARALPVPRPDPYQPASALHLFYLLRDDLPLLRRLLEAGCAQVGPYLELFHRGGAARIVGSSQAARRLSDLCQLATCLCEAWQEGRDTPVNLSHLAQSGLLSERYQEPVLQILSQNNKSARHLLQVLDDGSDPDLKGFRAKNRQKLEAWFSEQGHLNDIPPLDPPTLLARVQSALKDTTLSPREIQTQTRALLTLLP